MQRFGINDLLSCFPHLSITHASTDIETGDLLYSDGTSIFKLTPEKLHEVLHGSGIVKIDKDPLKLEITYD